MNKKQLITTIAIIVITSIGLAIAFYLNMFKVVSFDIKHDDINIAVYSGATSNNQKVGSLDHSGEIKLQTGDYTAVPSGDKYSNAPISFTVSSDVTVTIDPEYSQSYRETVLKAEISAINKAISNAYPPSVIASFTINTGDLYNNGTWYATTLAQNIGHPTEVSDIYHTVLKKENGAWIVKAKPALVLSAKDYPDIPFKILSDINAK